MKTRSQTISDSKVARHLIVRDRIIDILVDTGTNVSTISVTRHDIYSMRLTIQSELPMDKNYYN